MAQAKESYCEYIQTKINCKDCPFEEDGTCTNPRYLRKIFVDELADYPDKTTGEVVWWHNLEKCCRIINGVQKLPKNCGIIACSQCSNYIKS